MANWTTLKEAIANVIKTNGNQEITGQVLQNTLNSIINTVGENATFAGIATPTTNPGVYDGPVFYLAFQEGDYSNFGTHVKRNELTILYNMASGAWNKSILAVLSTLEENIVVNKIASNSLSKINKEVLINNIEFLRGYFVNAKTGNIGLGLEGATYGLRYIPVEKGKTYSIKVTSEEYSNYAVLSFSKTAPAPKGKVDFVISTVEENKTYNIDEAFTAIDNGYLILGDWSNGKAKFYEISSDLNLATIENVQETAQETAQETVQKATKMGLMWLKDEADVSARVLEELKKISDVFVTWDKNEVPENWESLSPTLWIMCASAKKDGDYPYYFQIKLNDDSNTILTLSKTDTKESVYNNNFANFTYGGKSGKLWVLAKWDELTYNFVSDTNNVILNNATVPIILRSNIQFLSQEVENLSQEVENLSQEVENLSQESITKSELNSKSEQSMNFCDYLRFIAESSIDYEFANDVTPNIEDVFAGNVSRISEITSLKTKVYLYGVFQSSYDWLQKLKNYQTEDGTPLQLNIKTRVYNHGDTRVAIDWGVRYKGSDGAWKIPKTATAIAANSFTDITLSITPNYKDLTTIIDLYTSITGQAEDTVLEFGNMDLYWNDPKKRDSRPIISAYSIDKGIEFEQLSDNLQKIITESSRNIIPKPKMNIICSGSSITWGDGRLDGSFVGALDTAIKDRFTKTLLSDELAYSVETTKLTNTLFYNKTAHKIVGQGAKVNFTLFGDEIAICQAKLRSATDYGIMTVRANGEVIGTFDNKNFIGSDTETFSGESLRKIRLKRPCTFDHEITVNGSVKLTDIQFNAGGYGGTVPEECEAFIYRGLDDNGSPVHYIELSESLGIITSVTVKYKYGKMIAYERSTVGQTQDPMTNESVYGSGTISYDPAHPTGRISSGMEFRGIDVNSFFIYKFDTAEMREFEIEITGGNNPYLVLNFITNRYNNLMNAGIGGWSVAALINGDKINDYAQFFKWFMPDIIFQESSTNDDWSYPTRRISRVLGNVDKDYLLKLWSLEISKITYNSDTDNYSVEMATGIISEITPTSLKSDDIVGTSTQVGDIVRIGNYYGDNKAITCRKISHVDTETGEIRWLQPLIPEELIGIENLSDLIGKEINIRDLSGYKAKYKELIEKIREISPQTKIVIVASGLSMYGLRQLWGYDIVHRELCGEYPNMEYCDITDWLYDAMKFGVSGSRKETVNSTGASSYDLTFIGNRNSWQGFKVLVDGIDVYGKTCHIESGYFYHADKDKTGTALNKNGVYDNKGVDNQTIPMKLVFDKDVPASGKQIEVQYSDTTWSSDYCHPSGYGAFVYGQMYAKFIN